MIAYKLIKENELNPIVNCNAKDYSSSEMSSNPDISSSIPDEEFRYQLKELCFYNLKSHFSMILIRYIFQRCLQANNTSESIYIRIQMHSSIEIVFVWLKT